MLAHTDLLADVLIDALSRADMQLVLALRRVSCTNAFLYRAHAPLFEEYTPSLMKALALPLKEGKQNFKHLCYKYEQRLVCNQCANDPEADRYTAVPGRVPQEPDSERALYEARNKKQRLKMVVVCLCKRKLNDILLFDLLYTCACAFAREEEIKGVKISAYLRSALRRSLNTKTAHAVIPAYTHSFLQACRSAKLSQEKKRCFFFVLVSPFP